MTGTVIYGINNIFTVLSDSDHLRRECRLKGKILKDADQEYSPLVPGDKVALSDITSKEAMIISRLDRRNIFSRWNIKRKMPQTIAANIELMVCLCSPEMPPFRPRFIDRVLIAAERDLVKPIICINKIDLNINPEMKDRLNCYKKLGYEITECSALNPKSLTPLKKIIKNKTVLFFGQSGVGKSTLINLLVPDAEQKTSEISEKYSRGRHTTNYSILLDNPDGGSIIDSPGVRDFFLYDITAEQLPAYYREFSELKDKCRFNPCYHIHEPDCAVLQALEKNRIHPDRYESYLRVHLELINSRN